MTKRKIFLNVVSVILVCVMMSSLSPMVIFANDEISVPTEVSDEHVKTGNEILELEHGIYQVGEEIFIDMEEADSSYLPIPYGDTSPNQNSVWSWSNGTYYTNFYDTNRCVWTNYRFTGYSTYTIDVGAKEYSQRPTPFDAYISVLLYKTYDGYATGSEISGSGKFNFINCNPSEKYAVRVDNISGYHAIEGWLYVGKK